MWQHITRRSFHLHWPCLAQIEKSLLGKLRRKTGYSISNCKKALELHENDFEQALGWLKHEAQKKGWEKAEKLQGRKTAQGLVGILIRKNVATMVEVNCETDFVAKNKEFSQLVCKVTEACIQHFGLPDRPNDIEKTVLSSSELLSIPIAEDTEARTLSALLALKIGKLGENMALRRGICLRVPPDVHISCAVHPAVPDASQHQYGKYGALVAFQADSEELPFKKIGRELAQHVIGMNPLTIGDVDEEPLENIDDETRLVHQEFLLDPSMTVGVFLHENGLKIFDFARFECGEAEPEVTEEKRTEGISQN